MDRQTIEIAKAILSLKKDFTFEDCLTHCNCKGKDAYNAILSMVKNGIVDVADDGVLRIRANEASQQSFLRNGSKYVKPRRKTEIPVIAKAITAKDLKVFKMYDFDRGVLMRTVLMKSGAEALSSVRALVNSSILVKQNEGSGATMLFNTLTAEDEESIFRIVKERDGWEEDKSDDSAKSALEELFKRIDADDDEEDDDDEYDEDEDEEDDEEEEDDEDEDEDQSLDSLLSSMKKLDLNELFSDDEDDDEEEDYEDDEEDEEEEEDEDESDDIDLNDLLAFGYDEKSALEYLEKLEEVKRRKKKR